MHRRDFLTHSLAGALGVLGLPSSALAIGDDDRFTVSLLKYSDQGWNTRPTALRRMLQEVEKRTSVEIKPPPDGDHVTFGPDLFTRPMLFMCGESSFEPWSNERIDMMRQWMMAGGFLVVDSSEGVSDGPFLRSVRRELARIFPDEPERAIPTDHVIYKSFYLFNNDQNPYAEPHGRVEVDRKLRGHFDGDRVPVVISANDMLGAWARDGFGRWEYDVVPGGSPQRELSFRMGINLVMYALCVNYKADQVHIPFILKRRKWRVQ